MCCGATTVSQRVAWTDAPLRLSERPARRSRSSTGAAPRMPAGHRGCHRTRRSLRRSVDRLSRILCLRSSLQVKACMRGSVGVPDSLGDKQVNTSGLPRRSRCCDHIPTVWLSWSSHLVPTVIRPFLFSSNVRSSISFVVAVVYCLTSATCANGSTKRLEFFCLNIGIPHPNGVWKSIVRPVLSSYVCCVAREIRKSHPRAATNLSDSPNRPRHALGKEYLR